MDASASSNSDSISPVQLQAALAGAVPPLVIDVRREKAFVEARDMIDGALRRDPATVGDWAGTLPAASRIAVYCVHGHEVSQNAAKALRERGLDAQFVEGGIEHWRTDGGALFTKPSGAATRWVTRERPKVDRIACPWLIKRFVDPSAEFLYVPTPDVRKVAD